MEALIAMEEAGEDGTRHDLGQVHVFVSYSFCVVCVCVCLFIPCVLLLVCVCVLGHFDGISFCC